jgi:hypothetical protein
MTEVHHRPSGGKGADPSTARPDQKQLEPVNFADPAAVRVWVSDLRAQISDAVATGEDALRPLGSRRLGRWTARRTLREASVAIEQLLAAAAQGVASGPRVTTDRGLEILREDRDAR